MPLLCRGRIVWVELLEPQGRNPTCRPAVIVTPDSDIRPNGEVWVVAISTQLQEAPAEVQVELPCAQHPGMRRDRTRAATLGDPDAHQAPRSARRGHRARVKHAAGPGTWGHMPAGLRHSMRAMMPLVMLLLLLK